MTEPTRLLTWRQVAEQLAISRRSIYSLTERGELPSVTIGRSRRWPADGVERFIRERLDEASAVRS